MTMLQLLLIQIAVTLIQQDVVDQVLMTWLNHGLHLGGRGRKRGRIRRKREWGKGESADRRGEKGSGTRGEWKRDEKILW